MQCTKLMKKSKSYIKYHTLFFYTQKDQEITGDILLDLNIEALKELGINTFGKRYKIMQAITLLKQESSSSSNAIINEEVVMYTKKKKKE